MVPPPKPARPVYPNMSPATSLRSINQSTVSSPPSHWGSASNLPLGYSTPFGVSPQHTMLGSQPAVPPLPREIDLSNYFPSSSGYTQAGQVKKTKAYDLYSFCINFVGFLKKKHNFLSSWICWFQVSDQMYSGLMYVSLVIWILIISHTCKVLFIPIYFQLDYD